MIQFKVKRQVYSMIYHWINLDIVSKSPLFIHKRANDKDGFETLSRFTNSIGFVNDKTDTDTHCVRNGCQFLAFLPPKRGGVQKWPKIAKNGQKCHFCVFPRGTRLPPIFVWISRPEKWRFSKTGGSEKPPLFGGFGPLFGGPNRFPTVFLGCEIQAKIRGKMTPENR